MTVTRDVVIIGAGMAGLACARALATAGKAPLVIDKGRGIGGRMATRRVALAGGEVSFDHGAQYFSVRDPGFTALLKALPDAVGDWQVGMPRRVGRPGMSALPRAMAAGLEVRQGVTATALRPVADGWDITTDGGPLRAARVVLGVPAPQVAGLLGAGHPLVAALRVVGFAPCLTLMAAFPPDAPRPFAARGRDDHPLAWIAQDSTKPGRAAPVTAWVAQASADWSAAHLEASPEAIAERMLPMLAEALGTDPATALHARAHRWRYARVTAPLGAPFLRSTDGRLWLGGDWCLGPRVEAAWQSGTAIARDMLERGHVQ